MKKQREQSQKSCQEAEKTLEKAKREYEYFLSLIIYIYLYLNIFYDKYNLKRKNFG